MPVTIGPAGVWSNFDRLAAGDVVAFARSAEAAGYDTFWTQETAGRDPFALLGHLAGVTRRIQLGVGIAVIYGRDPVAMRAGATTVHELSGGRMLLGLGASHRDTVSDVRGHDYRGPLTTMRDYLAAYRAAPYRAPLPFGEPPLVLAALRERMRSLAATEADGAFPYLVPRSYVADARGDEATVRARLRAVLDAGADQVALIPLTAEGLHADRATMERLAPPW